MTLRDELVRMLEARCHEVDLGGNAEKVVDAILARIVKEAVPLRARLADDYCSRDGHSQLIEDALDFLAELTGQPTESLSE